MTDELTKNQCFDLLNKIKDDPVYNLVDYPHELVAEFNIGIDEATRLTLEWERKIK